MEYNFLNEAEKEKLTQFNEDKVMLEAVQKILLKNIYHTGKLEPGAPWDNMNWAYSLGGMNDFVMDDEKVGAMLKTYNKAFAIVEDAFENIKNFKVETPIEDNDENPAV